MSAVIPPETYRAVNTTNTIRYKIMWHIMKHSDRIGKLKDNEEFHF